MDGYHHWLESEPTQNFGDFLTEFFMEELFYPIGMQARGIHLIGSVIDDMFVSPAADDLPDTKVVFWGCGLRQVDGLSSERRRHTVILSVRGPLSASDLQLGAATPIGDPAFLLPALYSPRRIERVHGRTICIPHFHDHRPDETLRELSGCDLVLRPNLAANTAEIRRFIDMVASAEFVLSAAMHGAIVAAAYGRPFGFWDNGQVDLPYKWRDIAASLGIPATFHAQLSDSREHYEAAVRQRLRIPSPWPSLAVAPFLLRPDALLKLLRREVAAEGSACLVSALDDRIGEMERSRPHFDRMIASLRERLKSLEREGEAGRRAAAELRARQVELLAEAAETAELRAAQARLCAEVADLQESGASLRAEMAQLQTDGRELAASVAGLRAGRERLLTALAEARAQHADAMGQLAALLAQPPDTRSGLKRTRMERDASLLERDEALRERDAALRERDAALQAADAAMAEARRLQDQEMSSLHARVHAADALAVALQASTSWKVTWPLRKVALRFPAVGRGGRRFLTVAWWACTLQIGRIVRPSRLPPQADSEPRSVHSRHTEEPALVPAPVGSDPAPMPAPSVVPVASPPKPDNGPTVIDPEPIDWDGPVVLIIDSVYPRPDCDSGSVDAVNFITLFQRLGYAVAFIADAELASETPYRMRLESQGVYCITASRYSSPEAFLRSRGAAIDVCFLSRVHSGGRLIEEVRRSCRDAKVIFNTVDLHHIREEREGRLKGDRRAINLAMATREREFAVARLADATIVVSSDEEKWLQKAVPGVPVYQIPLLRECPGRRNGFAHRTGIGFVGGYLHSPNPDAVHYFLDEVWPLVRQRLPEATFRALGADMPSEISARRDPGFAPVGYVSDLAGHLETVRVMVAPLRFGAGAKGKVVSSLAHGVPCVASPIAIEGMGLTDGRGVVAAATAREFADRVVEIYTNEVLWERLSQQGIDLVAARHSLGVGEERLRQILTDVWGGKPRSERQAERTLHARAPMVVAQNLKVAAV